MIIGIPKEIKNHEYRVGLDPESARCLVELGHDVIVETQAGMGIGYTDGAYEAVGAKVETTVAEIFAHAEMIVKVKEPQPQECLMLRPNQILFTYLHLASDPEQTKLLQDSGCVAIAYETVTDEHGGLPLLAPMSAIAGRLSIQAGAHCLEKAQGGRGILLGGVAGVEPAKVVVIGGGMVGSNAIRIAMGMCADVSVYDRSIERLQELANQFGPNLHTYNSNEHPIEAGIATADMVVGAVLIPGAAAPKIVTRDMLQMMMPGSVIVDVAIDQGGCFETSRPTTHEHPTYVEEDIVHYCVTNMPGAVPYTATSALNHETLPNAIELANKGYRQAMLDDPHLLNGLNVYKGKIVHHAVAEGVGESYTPAAKAIQQD